MKIATAFCATALLLAALPVSASYITLEDVDRGWYDNDGGHDDTTTNYLAGGCTDDGCGSDFAEYRNYFLFDLASVTGVIKSATLRLWMPPGGFMSPTGSETYELFDIETALDELGQRWGVDIFDDLGAGTIYGTHAATDADENTFIEITLTAAALADLNAAVGLGPSDSTSRPGRCARHPCFALGGAVTTLDPENNNELLFASSGAQHAYLVLETVPLPRAAWLLASAVLTLGRRRRKG